MGECTACLVKKPGWGMSCKWCSLKQTCRLSGKMGSSCDDHSQDKSEASIKNAQQCDARPPWQRIMDEAHGAGWISDQARYIDSIRCIQWNLGWEVLPATIRKQVEIDTSQGGRLGMTVFKQSEHSWLKVEKVEPEDLAFHAGLKVGSLITSLDGVLVHKPKNLTDAVDQIIASGGRFTLEYLEPDDSQPRDDAGNWGCVSALIREGIQAMLREKDLPSSMLQHSDRVSETTAQLQRANMSASTPEFDVDTWAPHLCTFVKSSVRDSSKCFIRSWQNFEFARLRRLWHGLHGRLLESVRAGPIMPLSPGAGKSGSGFGVTWDGAFKIKLGLKANSKVDEPQNLMRMMAEAEGHESLPTHFKKHPNSLINRVFGLLEIGLGAMTSHVAVLDDGFYSMDAAAKQAGLNFTRYDLKGASRNQDEKTGSGWCLINGDFKEREKNKLHLGEGQCLKLRAAVKADADFLQAHNMIDYSLLLLSVQRPQSDALTCSTSQRQEEPFCIEEGKHLYTLSIIDYLNDMSFAKSVESTIKGGKFLNYNRKISSFAHKICRTPTEERFHEEVLALVQKRGGLKKAFKSIDADNSGYLDGEEIRKFLMGIGLKGQQLRQLVRSIEYDAGPSHAPDKVSYKAFKYLFA
eukprot:TRINITY_DN23719_c0_g1_i1.p1 TRINITY_DN23719_c0_g1~~TRINITY_DN23719_c0_g1_i1.p1  ORF type:complete len:716 (+),score=110.80 TRINITY_DN23719_c0_g1_i1:247-2148(+)